jgi:predicted nucleic acid-binding protein
VAWYLDTSALLKLLILEPETANMRAWFASHRPVWSSQLLRTETLRAASRLGIDDRPIEDLLSAVSLVLPAASTFLVAARLGPPHLRTLDALHLATALELGADLEGLITYDERLIAGAQAASLIVVSPGA